MEDKELRANDGRDPDLTFKNPSSSKGGVFETFVRVINITYHANERFKTFILLICQYSKYDARFSWVGLKQGFRAYVYMIWIVLFFIYAT